MKVETDRDQRVATPGSEPMVRIRDLRKHFRRGDGSLVKAIDGVSLDAMPGEFIVLLGPSGCGKTTLLRSIAGLDRPDAGSIEIHGSVNFSSERGINVPPERRQLSMIFQSYALWPHMTAFQNVAYPLESKRRARPRKPVIRERVERVLELVGIPELSAQYPNQMSGGQQQRVALARSLVNGDGLVLFDEPLSNVDAKVREQLRIELVTMQRELGFCAVFVTHDQVEAMELAHRIAVIRDGQVAQLGPPRDVYDRPATRYVANFIGTTNELVGTVERTEPRAVSVTTPLGTIVGVSADPVGAGDAVAASWRPERSVVTADEPAAVNRWRAKVRAAMFVGSHTDYLLQVGDEQFRTWSVDADLIEAGSDVWLSVAADQVRVLPAD